MSEWRNTEQRAAAMVAAATAERAAQRREAAPPTQCQAEGGDRDACAGREACPGCLETVAARLAACDRAIAAIQPPEAAPPARPAATGELVDPRELIGAQEVCAICGWRTRKSIGDHQGAHGFPEPVATVSGTRIWTRTQVNEWKASR